MYIDWQTIITAGSVITALAVAVKYFTKAHKWFLKQEKQDGEIKSIKEEQTILVYGVLACLDGLEQLGCNHSVPLAKDKLEKHINLQAHK